MNFSWAGISSVYPKLQGRGGEELSSELSSALQRCLLGGKSGAGALFDWLADFMIFLWGQNHAT